MKRYDFNNDLGKFTIVDFENGEYSVYGNRYASVLEFKKIGKMPPNKHGNFYGREKAGFAACGQLIKSRSEN